MRPARSPALQSLLRRFARGIVEPLLDALPVGASSNQYLTRLLKTSRKKISVGTRPARKFWKANGASVRLEYDAWNRWIQSSCLDQPLPSSVFGSHEQVKFVFEVLLYGIALNEPTAWNELGESFTRKDLCELFRADLGHAVCPYCDIDTVHGVFGFEHFFPRSMSPYIIVAPENLYVACHGCNSPQIGKGCGFVYPAARPDGTNYGPAVGFEFGGGAVVARAPRRVDCANVFSMLQLASRYAEPSIYASVIARARQVDEIAMRLGVALDFAETLRHFDSVHARDTLYFAARAALIEEYARGIV